MSQTDEATIHTMEQLWRSEIAEPSQSVPGPKPRFELDEIVNAAIAVADTNPQDGVSMRAVAERLGVTAMALYGYVAGKDALVALAYDAVHAEMPDRAPVPWRDRVVVWAEDLVDLYVRHPWALQVSYARPVLGPNEQQVLESLVNVLRATNLDPEPLRRVVGMLFHTVRGTARTIADARSFEETSGLSEGEWWRSSSAALSEVVPDFEDRFPHTIWLLSQSARPATTDSGPGYVESQATANLKGGLEMLLDGLDAAMTSTDSRVS